jgi:hypothetical protein
LNYWTEGGEGKMGVYFELVVLLLFAFSFRGEFLLTQLQKKRNGKGKKKLFYPTEKDCMTSHPRSSH